MTSVAVAAVALAVLQAPASAAPSAPTAPVVTQDQGATDDSTRPDEASAALLAAQSGDPVEVLGDRSETQQKFANPDGTFTLDVASGPVRVHEADGSWVPVDTTLVQGTDGSWAPKAAAWDYSFSDGGKGTFAGVDDASGKNTQFGLAWPGTLPQPTAAGNMLTYPEVAPGVDLVVEALPAGFSHRLVVKSRPSAPLNIELPVVTTKAALSESVKTEDALTLESSSGDFVASASPAVMWDAQIDESSGDPANVAAVDVAVEAAPTSATTRSNALVGAGKSAKVSGTLVLSPDEGMLADPDTVYPVTIDPTFTKLANTDTWVQYDDYLNGQASSTELKAGSYDGVQKARSFVNFDVSAIEGKGVKITDTNLQLYNFYSGSCSSGAIEARRITADWVTGDVTWSNQPSTTTTDSASTSGAHGYSSSCPAADSNWDVDAIVQYWSDHAGSGHGFAIRATTETSTSTWRRYRSANYAPGEDNPAEPHLTINYNTYPNTPTSLTWTPKATYAPTGTSYATSVTPKLSAKISDPDGDNGRALFSVYLNGSSTPISGLDQVTGSVAASGGTSTYTIPSGKLTNGSTYKVKAWGRDGSLLISKAATSTLYFTVDTTLPAAPTVTSSAFPSGSWGGNTSGAFTFTSAATDVGSWRYWFDNDAPTVTTTTTNPFTVTLSPSAGWRVLHVQAVDKAGQSSAETTYSFGSQAGLNAPLDQARTQQFVPLQAVGAPAATGVAFQWKLPDASTWTDIDATQVKLNDTSLTSWSSVPLTTTSTQANTPVTAAGLPALAWKVTDALPADGAFQVRAVFTGVTGGTSPAATVVLDRKGFGSSYATAQVGPGTVSLQTGNYAVSATDVSIASFGSDLTVSRTFNSADPTAAGPFGPGWSASLPVESAGSDWTALSDAGSSVTLTDSEGGLWVFVRSGTTYIPVGDAVGLVLAKQTSASTYTLTDPSGVVVTFKSLSGFTGTESPTNVRAYRVQSVVEPGTAGATSYEYTSTTSIYPTAFTAPPPPNITCATSFVAGCRQLLFSYMPSTNLVDHITFKTVDGSGSTVTAIVACYLYDGNGRLAGSWDPRTAGSTCATPVLATTYTYDGAGRLATITPPGLDAWTISYGTGSDGTPSGYLKDVQQGTGGSALTESVRYHAPIDATTGHDHPDLSAAARVSWAQDAIPQDAAAVYGPGDAVSSTDLRDGTLHAWDVDGRETNTAVYAGTGQSGWKITTTEYDRNGNTVRSLSAGNRDRALALDGAFLDSIGMAGATSPVVARALDETSMYSADGIDLIETFGPLHVIQRADDATLAAARVHTTNTYGAYDPDGTLPSDPATDGPLHAITKTIEGASLGPDATAGSVASDVDTRETRTAYALNSTSTAGWKFRSPMRVTTEMGATADIISETTYDPATGAVVQQRQPSGAGSGTGADTRTTSYYTTGTRNDASCVNSAWYGLPCKVQAAAQPGTSGLPQLPVTTYTYDALLRPLTVTDTVAGTPSGTRVTTTTYDGPSNLAERTKTVSVTGVGTAVPTVSYGYDSSTGLATTVSDSSGTLTTGYDSKGRATSFTDADGALTTTSYDTRGRVDTVTDQRSDATTVGTTSYGYTNASGDGDHRGLTTSLTHSDAGGAFTGSYDADGTLVSQSWPNGMTQDFTSDATGDTTAMSYGDGVSETQVSTIHGQWAASDATLAGYSHRDYSYDPAGRLTGVADIDTAGICSTRGYLFDGNSNRTARKTYGPDADGTCQATTAAATQSLTYDTADRLTTTGLTYDAFGRIATLPAGLAPTGTSTTLGYYVNDLANTITVGSATRTWSLDPAGRFRALTTSGLGSTATTNHYAAGSGDSPAWTRDTDSTGTATETRLLSDLTGNLALTATTTAGGGSATLSCQLTGLHGDVLRTTTPGVGATGAPDGDAIVTDEFGVTTNTSTYGWLGGKQRQTDTTSGLILMGVRLYNPVIGRFLQTDPVYGGNATTYGYPQDPVNMYDLNGQWGWRSVLKVAVVVAAVVGAAACGASVVCAVAVGAAAGALSYAASHAGTNSWRWSGFALSVGLGAAGGRGMGWMNRLGHVGWGNEIKLSRTIRFGTGKWFGGRGRPWYARVPHYHRGATNKLRKLHRPWQGW